MQVKVSMVPEVDPAPDAPEVRVGVSVVDEKGAQGAPVQLTKEEPEITITIAVGGRAMLTADLPPLEYNREQASSMPGKWPEKEPKDAAAKKAKEAKEKEEAAAKASAPKSGGYEGTAEGGGAAQAKHDPEASSRKR